MKLLSRNTDYAVRALMILGVRERDYTSARSISEVQRIPYSFLRKILQTLIQNGLVESREGGKGGFRLAVAPERIKLINLIRIFQGGIKFSECMFRKKVCFNRANCALRERILEIEHFVTKKFSALTIAELIKKTELKRKTKLKRKKQ